MIELCQCDSFKSPCQHRKTRFKARHFLSTSPLDQRSPPCPRQPNLWREQIRVSSDFMSHNREGMNELTCCKHHLNHCAHRRGSAETHDSLRMHAHIPPEASSPPPERTRQLQQSPNSGLVACGVTGLDCGGRLDMFRLKCVKSKRIQVPKAPLYCI